MRMGRNSSGWRWLGRMGALSLFAELVDRGLDLGDGLFDFLVAETGRSPREASLPKGLELGGEAVQRHGLGGHRRGQALGHFIVPLQGDDGKIIAVGPGSA